MLRLMRCRCIQLLRDRTDMFWILLFPMLLGTMYSFAFTNLATIDLEAIPVAVVVMQENEQSKQFEQFAEEATDILNAVVMDEKTAMLKLESGEIEGIYQTGSTHKLIVTKSDLNTSILQMLLEVYQRNEDMIMRIIETHPENLNKALEEIADYKSMTETIDMSGGNQDAALPYFLALIGMACLYGCFIGMRCPIDMQANLSALGARRSVTPTHRLQLIVADMLATFVIHFASVIIFLLYLRFILQINFGADVKFILLTSAAGSIVGVSFGMLISSLGKIGEGMKIAIILAASMVCSFFAGLMVPSVKDIIERYIPILNRINPAALIADAFYSLSVYKDMERYYRSLMILAGMSIVLAALSFIRVRRERYDSI